jgi:predicted unusual protein kinase regulating ubiquinone biosynthesis (AarF/ABC1/UbiB family)
MTEQGRHRPYVVPQGRVRRAAPLVGMAGRTAGEAVVASLRRNGAERFHARAAERYAEMLGRSKGVLMKAGQILSFVTVGAAVPAEYRTLYQSTLARLQDSAPPMPAELAASVVEEELGAPPDALFAEFAAEPLAAASIGQVHAATMHDGRRVAVKVQYPGVEEAIRADLRNTELLATFFSLARTLAPDLTRVDVRALAREVADRIGEEIDYRAEARNQAEFADTAATRTSGCPRWCLSCPRGASSRWSWPTACAGRRRRRRTRSCATTGAR